MAYNKVALQAELDRQAEILKEISIKAAAQAVGITRMKREQVLGAAQSFTLRHPEYKLISLCDDKQYSIPNPSLWETGTLTMCEYEEA